MKNILPLLFGAALIIVSVIYIVKAEEYKKASAFVPGTFDAEVDEGYNWELDEPAAIVSPDFRNMNWDMDYYSIACQEKRSPDDVNDCFMLFRDIKFSVFEHAELYYYSGGPGCRAAEYKITVLPDDPPFNIAESIIKTYLDEMFAPADENSPSVRHTYSAVITYAEDIRDDEKIFYIRFDMPEKYHDGDYKDRTKVWA